MELVLIYLFIKPCRMFFLAYIFLSFMEGFIYLISLVSLSLSLLLNVFFEKDENDNSKRKKKIPIGFSLVTVFFISQ